MTIYKEAVVLPPPSNVVLKLTEHEAGVLLAITAAIGGDPNGPRGVMDDIHNGLVRLGIHRTAWYYGSLLVEGVKCSKN